MTSIYMDLLLAILALALGYATIKYKLGRYITFVNEKKYDTDKVGKTAGIYIMAYGGINIFLVIARLIAKGTEVGNALDKASVGIIVAIALLMFYDIRKHCKREEKEEFKEPHRGKKKKKKKKKKRK